MLISPDGRFTTRSGRSTFSQADICRESRLSKQYPALHAPTVLDSITLPTMTLAGYPSDRPTPGLPVAQSLRLLRADEVIQTRESSDGPAFVH
jgi:hypothetical protein